MKEPMKLEAHGRGFELLRNVEAMGRVRTAAEATVLEKVRSGDFEEIEIEMPNGEIKTIRTTSRSDPASKLEDLLDAEQVENFSLDTQERECIAFCTREGYEVDRIFRKEGESAKTADRPELQAMLNYCGTEAKRRDIGAVDVYRVDRLARNLHDHAVARAGLSKVKVRICAVTETFDDSPAGQFIGNVMASAAQLDNEMRAARTMTGVKEGLSRGRWMWKAPRVREGWPRV